MKVVENLEKNVKQAFIGKVIDLHDNNPEENVGKIFSLVKKLTYDEESKQTIDFVYKLYETNKSTHDYIQNLLQTSDKKCVKKLFTNFFSNAIWFGGEKRKKYLTDEDTKIPFVILLSPTMRCNLSCTGCYAAKYDKNDDIPYAEVDRIVKEARGLGIYYFVILGGEPFLDKLLLAIYEKYHDVVFTPFTNGTLFDDTLADRLKTLGNVFPMFSLEGFEKETDARRGAGTFQKVMQSMDLLRERGVLFGVSSAATRNNMDIASSDEFIDMLIAKGSKLSWYFIYMPVGKEPDVTMMLTPEQRIELGRRVRHIRTEKPYFAIDFFNDAPYVGGCIAGKYYCHINSREDVEPCIFAHFACNNLKGKSLLDVFRSPFFKTLRHKQPYNDNLLLPCMMIDNPDVIREIVQETGAYPTDDSAKQMISDPKFMQQLDQLAEEFKPYAEKAWEKDFNKTGNLDMAKG